MRIIFVILLCLVLAYKGPTMAANTEQSCLSSLQDDLLQSCKANEQFCTENNKLLRNHIELLTNSMEEMTINSCGKLYDQVQKLLKKENEFGKEIEKKNELIKQLEEKLKKEQMEISNYISKQTVILDGLKQKVEQLQLSNNLCESEKKEELQTKNDQIRLLQENMSKLQMENVNYKSKENSMAPVINEQQQENLCEKENIELALLKVWCKSALVEIDQEKTKLQTELRKSVDRLKKTNPASCIERDTSGVQRVTLCTRYSFDVLCNADIAGPGWTVIQQRIRGGVDFNRDWNTYRNGFGDFWGGDFFLGLEKIHRLTAEQPHELYIQITRFNGSTSYARYDEFAISGEEDNYSIKLGEFNGTATDEFSYHNNIAFSTYDRDNDRDYFQSCADNKAGGWWYKACANSNLNGIYYGDEVNKANGIYWEKYKSLKQVKMMIRPKLD